MKCHLTKPEVTEIVKEFIRKFHVLYNQTLMKWWYVPKVPLFLIVSTIYVFVCACLLECMYVKPPKRVRNSDDSSNTLDMFFCQILN